MFFIYFWAGAYSILSADDFSHGVGFGLYKAFFPLHLLGSFLFMWHIYFSWQGTFFAMFLQAFLSPINGFGLTQLRIVMMLNILLIFGTIILLIYNLLKNLSIESKCTWLFIGALSLLVLYGYTTYQEVFFWFSGCTSYGFPFSAMLIGLSFILRYYRTKNNRDAVFAKMFGFLACGGTLMIAGAGCFFALLIVIYYTLIEKENNKNGRRIFLWWLAGAVINTIAPGNYYRQTQNGSGGIHFFQSIKNSLGICLRNYKCMLRDSLLFEVLAICVIVGIVIGLKTKIQKDKKRTAYILLFSVIAPAASWVAAFPATLGYSASGALNNRCDFVINSTFVLSVVFAAFVFGYFLASYYQNIGKVSICVLFSAAVIWAIWRPYPFLNNKYYEIGKQLVNGDIQGYYRKCEQFLDGLEDYPDGTDVRVSIDEMPHGIDNTKDFYYYEEPADPENWLNSALAQYYDLSSFAVEGYEPEQ